MDQFAQEPKKPEPDMKTLSEMAMKINAGRERMVAKLKREDSFTGQAYIDGSSDAYKVFSAKENDKFRMEEGYEVEYITKLIKTAQDKMMSMFED